MKFSTKKMGVNFFPAKKTKPGGGGARGRFGKSPYFCRIFFCAPFPKWDGWVGWVGWVGWDLCAGLFYEHRFAMLITMC